MNTKVALTLTTQTRKITGKAHSRRLRRLDDLIPAVIYGAKKPNVLIEIPHNELLKSLKNELFYSQIITLTVDDKKEKVVLKALQRHPSKPKILHVDFLRVKANEALIMKIPLHFIGEDESPGIKAGGVASRLINELEIKCLPADLPEFIEVDITKLELDKAIHLSEITLPQGSELAVQDSDNDPTVINIHIPQEQSEEEPEEAASEEVPTEGDTESSDESGKADDKTDSDQNKK